LIQVNLLPGGKKRSSKGPGLSFKLPSMGAFPTDSWVLGASAVVIVVVALTAFLYVTTNGSHGELTVSIRDAVADSTRYADLIQANDALTARRDSIAQRVNIIQEIDSDRFVWPHILDEVARALPDYTWVTELIQVRGGDPLQIRIAGRAGNNFAVTQFMESLEASFFIRNVDLISTEQVVEGVGGGVERIVNQFSFEAEFERPPVELLETIPLFDAGPEGP
jgi:Tfp pilus assembly protein PilN